MTSLGGEGDITPLKVNEAEVATAGLEIQITAAADVSEKS